MTVVIQPQAVLKQEESAVSEWVLFLVSALITLDIYIYMGEEGIPKETSHKDKYNLKSST